MQDTDRPLVSCVMPTRNRTRLARQAIWYFLCQDYPNRELIVVDDGREPVSDGIPNDDRIRYVRLDRPTSRGAKRNLACELARGDLIAHWDDDDWIAPQRLSVQVDALLASGADVCGVRDLLHYDLGRGRAWLERPRVTDRQSLAGPTLLYRRAAWSGQPFPDRDSGDDRAFLEAFAPDRIHSIAVASFYVAVLHGSNTTARNLADPRWEPRPIEEVTNLLGFDRDFYVGLRHRETATGNGNGHRALESLNVAATFLLYDGYGSLSEYLVMGMLRAGASVNVQPLRIDPAGLPSELLEVIQHSKVARGAATLAFTWLFEPLTQFNGSRDLFMYTMWETSLLPAGAAANLNHARAVFVPSAFCAHSFRDSGVTAPIEVIPHGVDPERYPYYDRSDRAGLTTLMVGTFVPRKNMDEGIAAWKLAFADDPDAQLTIKTRFRMRQYVRDDPRITFIDAEEPTLGIAHWYQQADVLLALGNEGFGLPLVEGMATGLPVIALNAEGQADVCAEAAPAGCLLTVDPARWVPFDFAPYGPCGIRAVPAVDDIADRLTWVANHRREARAMGQAASDWVGQHRNVWNMAPAVLDVIERHARPARSFRRTRTVWDQSHPSEGAVAAYTTRLIRSLPGVNVTQQPPHPGQLKLLHVQHDPTLFSDRLLTQHIQAARRARVPVVITEHSLPPHAQAWEFDADALIALTGDEAQALRQRWPGKLVEHIPCGCPTWFPPRKASRGRVIGCVSPLHASGLWEILGVLRCLDGTSLELFSAPADAETEASWAAATAGLAVRRTRERLPPHEVARRLAAEADLLIFWHVDGGQTVDRVAIGAGLATGAPVLTAPTASLRDLAEVVAQPFDLVDGVRQLLEDTPRRDSLTQAAFDYCHAHAWQRIAERHVSLWESVERT